MNIIAHPWVRAGAGILAILAALAAVFVAPLGYDAGWQDAFLEAASILGAVAGITSLAGWQTAKNAHIQRLEAELLAIENDTNTPPTTRRMLRENRENPPKY